MPGTVTRDESRDSDGVRSESAVTELSVSMRGRPSLRTVARVLAMTMGASFTPAASAAADCFALGQNGGASFAARMEVFGVLGAPNEYDELLALARQANEQKNWPAVEEHLLSASKIKPLGEGDLYNLRFALREQGKTRDALSVAAECWNTYGTPFSALIYCEAYLDNFDFPNARIALGQILEMRETEQGDFSNFKDWINALHQRLSLKRYEFRVELDCNKLAGGRSAFEEKGYYQCYVPQDVGYQLTEGVRFENCEKVEECRDGAGNRYFKLWPQGDSPVVAIMDIAIVPLGYDLKELACNSDYSVPDELQYYLGVSPGIDPSTATVANLVSQLKGANRYETLANISKWWKTEITYGPGKRTSEDVLTSRVGTCTPQTLGMCALLRACGIAARPARGFSCVEGEQGFPKWHSWVEYYEPALSAWVPFECGVPPGLTVPTFVRIAAEVPEDDSSGRCSTDQITDTMWAPGADKNQSVNILFTLKEAALQ